MEITITLTDSQAASIILVNPKPDVDELEEGESMPTDQAHITKTLKDKLNKELLVGETQAVVDQAKKDLVPTRIL